MSSVDNATVIAWQRRQRLIGVLRCGAFNGFVLGMIASFVVPVMAMLHGAVIGVLTGVVVACVFRSRLITVRFRPVMWSATRRACYIAALSVVGAWTVALLDFRLTSGELAGWYWTLIDGVFGWLGEDIAVATLLGLPPYVLTTSYYARRLWKEASSELAVWPVEDTSRCLSCGYSLIGLDDTAACCPECGGPRALTAPPSS